MNITGYKILIIDTHDNDRVLVEERTQLGAPVLRYPGADDKYAALMASAFDFNISVPGAADGAFYHLYTGNETRYRCELHNQDDVLLWAGFLLPDQYSEPYLNTHYFVDMTATDGIGRLKGHDLPYQYYNGEFSVIKLIAECLKLTGLTQDIFFAPAIEASNGYRWDEIAVDGSTYRGDEPPQGLATNTKKPKRDNAYQILERLVENIGCTVFTWGGQWYIVGINRKHEVESPVQKYDANGVFLGAETLVRPLVNLNGNNHRFVKTPPNVSIVSPWKTITITWGLDEDGNLLPENAITEAKDKYSIATGNPFTDAANHGLPGEVPLINWQKTGAISAGVASADGTALVDWPDFSFVPVQVARGPYNLNVSYRNPANNNGETTEGTALRYIELKTPKFVKVTDEYFFRSLKFKASLFSINVADVSEDIENGDLKDFFRCDILVGDTVIVSSRPGATGHDNFQFEMDWRGGSTEADFEEQESITKYTWAQLEGDLERENITVPHNGYLNVRFYAPVSENPATPLAVEYTFADLELEYTAQDEWYDELTRDIDYTTKQDLDIFHGDSMQDLTKKQFRFRRPVVFNPESHINIFSHSVVATGGTTVFYYAISWQQAEIIQQNPGALTVTFEAVVYTINQLYAAGSASYGAPTGWTVLQLGGVWYIALYVPEVTGIWASVENFLNMNLATGGVQNGYVPENNEERENWHRYGYAENLRFGLALGRVYHDVQPEPIVKVEGDAFGLFNPLELFVWRWMENRVIMPVSMDLRLSESKTRLVLMESKINDVDDYTV